MRLDARNIGSGDALECYVTAAAMSLGPVEGQAKEAFTRIRDLLDSTGAHLLLERIFLAPEAREAVLSARSAAYAGRDDGVGPSVLAAPPGPFGPLVGVQAHAVRCASDPKVLRVDGLPVGRALGRNGHGLVVLSGLAAPEAGGATDQADAMLRKAEQALRQAGTDLTGLARTWMWLDGILGWYGQFNRVRNRFYSERGLIEQAGGRIRLPASTGVGIGPAVAGACAMDAVAFLRPDPPVEYHLAGGRQGSAFSYGSAFSRAAKARTPAGMTVYVSGTAAIDPAGNTTHIGDARGQIADTLDNVRAVLADSGCADGDVVQAIAYCKTAQVERIFRDEWSGLGWPMLVMVGDICRDDLLFEVEATAVLGARKA